MTQDPGIFEPEIDPDDTHPTQTMPKVEINETPGWQRLIGLASLLGAVGFTIATIILLLTPGDVPDIIPDELPGDLPAVVEQQPDDAPTSPPVTAPPSISTDGEVVPILPTLDPQSVEALLQEPPAAISIVDAMRIDRDVLNPFTIIPDRPRNEVIQYTVVRGDTLETIARRFGIQPESIVWSNPRRIVQVLRPGDVLDIPPVDGVYARTIGSTRTIRDYAADYGIEDTFDVLDSEYNRHLIGYSPDDIPPSGTRIFFPGGEAEVILWQQDIEVTRGGGGTGPAAAPDTVVFQNGQPGSCAPQPITGGTFWANPLPAGSYTVTQGFSGFHPGIDLAGTPGTPVSAANGGRVIFAGWNSFGYGNAIAIIHGPNMTVYGHLQDVFVSCGQDVATGTVIGTMGSTGQSSGPHLHFEILSGSGGNYSRINPSSYIGF